MNDESPEALRARLNAETGRLGWDELVPHFARGAVVRVAPGLDLVEVAACFAEDRREHVEAWLKAGNIGTATEDDARRWAARSPVFWAVVVAPWVLAQEAGDAGSDA